MKAGMDYIGIGVGAFILNDKKQVLLQKRGSKSKNEVGVWVKPGGAVEYGETAEEALLREIKEELDIEIEILDFLGYEDHLLKKDKQHWIALFFLAKVKSGEAKNMEPSKTDEIGWFDLNNMPEEKGTFLETSLPVLEKYLTVNNF